MTVASSKARDTFSNIVDRASRRKQRVIVTKRGKELVAVVPIEDLHLMEKLIRQEEDRQDVAAARKAKAEMKATGQKGVSIEKARYILDL